MEVAGLAIGIVGLYTTCRDCYSFFTTQSILKAWGFHWQIKMKTRTKLQEYLLNNRFKAEGVFNTLSALADTLSNQEKLIKGYGIQLHPTQAIQDASESINNVRLAIQDAKIDNIQPFKWALKDRDNFRSLISDLRSHSESLYRLCPESAFGSMNIYITMECLAQQESPAGLKWTSRLATENAEVDERSSVRAGYELLASAATLKASVNENRDRVEADDNSLTTIDEEQPNMCYLGKGLALFEGQVVYVEMRDYRGPPAELTPKQKQKLKRRRNRARANISVDRVAEDSSAESEDDEPIEMDRPADPKLHALTRNFFNTFQGANVMKSVYGLDIAGMIDHTDGEHRGHCSILYRLPGTIGVQNRQWPAENLKLRAPMTLKSLLGKKQQKGIRSILGARLELARNLVVMFFTEHVNALQEDRYEVKIEIDVSKLILMGYIFSRPDDIIISTEPSEQEPMAFTMRYPSSSLAWDDPMDKRAKSKRRVGTPRADSIYGRNALNQLTVSDQTKDIKISGFTLDYYQHPAKHADPMRQYRHAYDELSSYSLRSLDDEEDHYERRRRICQVYLDRLRWECGDTYADVVLSCIMVNSTNDEIAKASERELCARIVADLEAAELSSSL
ncbi:hypothetical protein B0T26DRAFT_742435 [Lasiosphaeria miniovina]|uniref:Prion-inhibition and propagation HeLo domain-containing protein n=1 Tax=Lasiosphaeria miniovina TaxID=1954250 RepID=A0AA40ADL7_9PEZI|nr:uncharacterized protein B0T26DRAFT_742435 [Lasiosphaeria miniovina]KAK0713954.1 hypothetical protein B0T26DRAFT_742435 [Lasiosphaeria miniovina]